MQHQSCQPIQARRVGNHIDTPRPRETSNIHSLALTVQLKLAQLCSANKNFDGNLRTQVGTDMECRTATTVAEELNQALRVVNRADTPRPKDVLFVDNRNCSRTELSNTRVQLRRLGHVNYAPPLQDQLQHDNQNTPATQQKKIVKLHRLAGGQTTPKLQQWESSIDTQSSSDKPAEDKCSSSTLTDRQTTQLQRDSGNTGNIAASQLQNMNSTKQSRQRPCRATEHPLPCSGRKAASGASASPQLQSLHNVIDPLRPRNAANASLLFTPTTPLRNNERNADDGKHEGVRILLSDSSNAISASNLTETTLSRCAQMHPNQTMTMREAGGQNQAQEQREKPKQRQQRNERSKRQEQRQEQLELKQQQLAKQQQQELQMQWQKELRERGKKQQQQKPEMQERSGKRKPSPQSRAKQDDISKAQRRRKQPKEQSDAHAFSTQRRNALVLPHPLATFEVLSMPSVECVEAEMHLTHQDSLLLHNVRYARERKCKQLRVEQSCSETSMQSPHIVKFTKNLSKQSKQQSQPLDQDVVYNNAQIVPFKTHGWGKTRIEWLTELERCEEVRRRRLEQSQRRRQRQQQWQNDQDELLSFLDICCLPCNLIGIGMHLWPKKGDS